MIPDRTGPRIIAAGIGVILLEIVYTAAVRVALTPAVVAHDSLWLMIGGAIAFVGAVFTNPAAVDKAIESAEHVPGILGALRGRAAPAPQTVQAAPEQSVIVERAAANTAVVPPHSAPVVVPHSAPRDAGEGAESAEEMEPAPAAPVPLKTRLRTRQAAAVAELPPVPDVDPNADGPGVL